MIVKKEKAWWTRLTAQIQKPVWLKIDFDKWQSEDDLNDDEVARDVRDDYPDLYDQLQKDEMGFKPGKLDADIKTTYNTLC